MTVSEPRAELWLEAQKRMNTALEQFRDFTESDVHAQPPWQAWVNLLTAQTMATLASAPEAVILAAGVIAAERREERAAARAAFADAFTAKWSGQQR